MEIDTNPNKKNQRAQGMVEFAIVLPVLLLLMIGIVEFGRLLFVYSAVVSASREAARYGSAIESVGGGVPRYQDCDGIRSAARRLGSLAGVLDSNISIQYDDGTTVTDASCPPTNEIELGDRITVDVLVNYAPITQFVNLPSFTVSSSSSRTIVSEVEIGEGNVGGGSGGTDLPIVNFRTTNQTAIETIGAVGVVVEMSKTTTDPVKITFNLSGGAVEGADYTISPSSHEFIIPPGSKEGLITVYPVDDQVVEGDESLVIGFGYITNAIRGPQDIHTITLQDPPNVEFMLASSSVPEDVGTAFVMLQLDKPSSQDISVSFSRSGTATWGGEEDYTISPSPVVIPAGTTQKGILVDVVDDDFDEFDETVVLNLDAVTNGMLGAITNHTLTIIDNDDTPVVHFERAASDIGEDVGQGQVKVVLTGKSDKAVKVPFHAENITTVDADYRIDTSSPLIFNPGDQEMIISMTMFEGDGWEVDEYFKLVLDTPINGVLGTPSTHQVTIVESSVPPDIFFSVNSSRVDESDPSGKARITVAMSNPWLTDILLKMSVIDGSAIKGDDYTVSSNYLEIPSGTIYATYEIGLIDDELYEEDENLTIKIESISSGEGVIDTTRNTHNLIIESNELNPCEVLAYEAVFEDQKLILPLNNVGEDVTMTGGSITWPESLPATPLLKSIYFDNIAVYNGSEAPGTFDFSASNAFKSETDSTILVQFENRALGNGTYRVVANFENAEDTAVTCQIDQSFTYTSSMAEPDCGLLTVNNKEITSPPNHYEINLQNDNERSAYLSDSTINWPGSGGEPFINYMEFLGNQYWVSNPEEPPVTSSTFSQSPTPPGIQLQSGAAGLWLVDYNDAANHIPSFMPSGIYEGILTFMFPNWNSTCTVTASYEYYSPCEVIAVDASRTGNQLRFVMENLGADVKIILGTLNWPSDDSELELVQFGPNAAPPNTQIWTGKERPTNFTFDANPRELFPTGSTYYLDLFFKKELVSTGSYQIDVLYYNSITGANDSCTVTKTFTP